MEEFYTLDEFKRDLAQAKKVTYQHTRYDFKCKLEFEDGRVVMFMPRELKQYSSPGNVYIEPADIVASDGFIERWCEFHRNATYWPVYDWRVEHPEREKDDLKLYGFMDGGDILGFWRGYFLTRQTGSIKDVPELLCRLTHFCGYDGTYSRHRWKQIAIFANDNIEGRWGFNHWYKFCFDITDFVKQLQLAIDENVWYEFQIVVSNSGGFMLHLADALLEDGRIVWYEPRQVSGKLYKLETRALREQENEG